MGTPVLTFSNVVPAAKADGPALLRIYHALFPGKAKASEARGGVSFCVEAGNGMALLGEGSQWVLEMAAGLQKAQQGQFTCNGRALAALGKEDAFINAYTAGQNLRLICRLHGCRAKQAAAVAEQARILCGIGETLFEQRPLEQLQKGLRAQLWLTLSLLLEPQVLILQGALELCPLPFREDCLRRIRAQQRKGMAVLLCTQELEIAARLCTQAVWLRDGQVYRQGPFLTLWQAYHTPRGLLRYPSVPKPQKGSFAAMQAAFSAPLTPEAEHASVRVQLEEAQRELERMNQQNTALARANDAFAQQELELLAKCKELELRNQQLCALLNRTLKSFTELVSLLQRQFSLLYTIHEGSGLKGRRKRKRQEPTLPEKKLS